MTLYIVVVVVMAAATVIERYEGTDFVSAHLYGSWWFSALWALLVVAATALLARKRERRPSVLALHLSFVVILAGALLTHLTAIRGIVYLRQGKPVNTYLTKDMQLHPLPFTITLDHFEILYHEGTDVPSDYVSHVSIGNQAFRISMNHIATSHAIRLYQSDYDDDLQGSILAMSSDPWGIPVTYCGYALLFIALPWMLLDPRGEWRQVSGRRRRLTIGSLLAAIILAVCFFSKMMAQKTPLIPVLNTPLIAVHVGVIFTAYALLALTFINSLTALVWHRRAMQLQQVSLVLLYPAIACLGYGIFIGAIWANLSWGTYWSWDPKETWALITFMVYAIPLHKPCRHTVTFYHLYLTLAFLTILMTYFGVNYLLGGMHSYA